MNVRLKRARELAGYAVQLTKDEGLPTMLKRGAGFVKRRCFGKRARYLPAKKVLEAQRAEMAGKTAADCGLPTISILTPLYNTPEKYLREFLDSFVNQTASNGQLCLADASDAEHADVKRIVEEYQTKNQRIVYKKIENKGIAANTNAAAELAVGEYLALADHDDILAPHAMYTMGKAILQLRQRGEPDGFLYSDEALFTKSIQRPMVAHFKPDYAPDYLLCCNYICHLAVFRKALWDAIGGERPECDGSQDHDLFLRLAEKTGGAAHVPQVLYYWRVHAGSTSGGADAKPYVAAAAKKALADHLARTGRTGTVEDGLFPSTYRVKWDIVGDPKVSILIPNKDHTDDLEKCLHSIWTKTSWENFEVIVIENNSTDPATFTYYKEARQRYDGLQVVNYPQKGFNFSGINNFGRQYARGLPAAAEQRRGGAQCRLAHGAAAAVRPPRRRGHLRRRAFLPGRDVAACRRCDRPWRLRGPQPQIPQGGRQRLHVPRCNGAGLFRRHRCLPAGKDQRVGRSGRSGRSLCGGLQRCGFLPAGAGCRIPHCVDTLCSADPLREQEPRRRRKRPGEGPALCRRAAAAVCRARQGEHPARPLLQPQPDHGPGGFFRKQ